MLSHITHENCVRSTVVTCLLPPWVLTCWTVWGVVLCCWTGSAQHFIFRVRLILWTVHPEDGGTLIILTLQLLTQWHSVISDNLQHACGNLRVHILYLLLTATVWQHILMHITVMPSRYPLFWSCMQLLKAWTDSRHWTMASLLVAW